MNTQISYDQLIDLVKQSDGFVIGNRFMNRPLFYLSCDIERILTATGRPDHIAINNNDKAIGLFFKSSAYSMQIINFVDVNVLLSDNPETF
jgi:hypothetical protein